MNQHNLIENASIKDTLVEAFSSNARKYKIMLTLTKHTFPLWRYQIMKYMIMPGCYKRKISRF